MGEYARVPGVAVCRVDKRFGVELVPEPVWVAL